jgi:predicted RNase H-like HicB family nuclease
MKIKVVIHEAEEGGFWAEVPAIPGCATQGETFEELLTNLYAAIEGCWWGQKPGFSRLRVSRLHFCKKPGFSFAEVRSQVFGRWGRVSL